MNLNSSVTRIALLLALAAMPTQVRPAEPGARLLGGDKFVETPCGIAWMGTGRGYMVVSDASRGRKGVTLTRLSGAGDVEWERTYRSPNNANCLAARPGLKEGIVAAGVWAPLEPPFMSSWVLVTREDGAPRRLVTSARIMINSVAPTAEGGALAVGRAMPEDKPAILHVSPDGGSDWLRLYEFSGSAGFASVATRDGRSFAVAGGSRGGLWVARIEGTGSVKWQHLLIPEAGSFASGVAVASDDSIVAVGRTKSGASGGDVHVARFTSAGVLSWERTIGTSDEELPTDVTIDGKGSAVVAGTTGGTQKSIWLAAISSRGAVEWSRSYALASGSIATEVHVARSDSGVVIASSWERAKGDVRQPALILSAGQKGAASSSCIVQRVVAASATASVALAQQLAVSVKLLPPGIADVTPGVDATMPKVAEACPTGSAPPATGAVALATPAPAHGKAALPTPPPPTLEILTAEKAKIAGRAAELLAAKHYSELDKLARELLSSRSRFMSGDWKLEAFHEGTRYRKSPLRGAPRDAFMRIVEGWHSASASPASAIAAAQAYTDRARAARGGDFADSVTGKGWKSYRDDLQAALSILEKERSTAASDPAYYTLRVYVLASLDSRDPRIRASFDAGAKLAQDYMLLHAQMGNFVLPKWGGESRDLERLANQVALANGKPLGSWLYAFYASVAQVEPQPESYGFAWARVRQGLSDRLAQYPDSSHNRHRALWLAWRARDRSFGSGVVEKGVYWDDDAAQFWPNRQALDEARTWALGEKSKQ